MFHKSSLLFLIICVCGIGSSASFADDFFSKANALYDNGQYKEAVPFYRAAIDEGRYEPFAWFNLGNTLVQLQKNEVALVAYRRTVELLPDFVKAWVLLGDLYFLGDDLGNSIASYKRAIELGEDTDHIHYALGECFWKSGDYTLAQKHYERALYLNPDRMGAWYGLADIYESLNDYEFAIKTLNNAIQQTASAGADAYFTISNYYQSMDSLSKALTAMEDGLLIDPQNVSARRYLAQMYLKANSPWMAVFTIEEGLRYNKEKAVLLVDLGQIYFEQKRYEEAFECFLEAWKLGNSQGRIGAENVGHTWYNAGNQEQAEIIYKRIRERK